MPFSYSRSTEWCGGGEKLRLTGEYKLLVEIIGKDIYIKTDEEESDIPLLLSKSSMKKAGVKMVLKKDTAIIIGKS